MAISMPMEHLSSRIIAPVFDTRFLIWYTSNSTEAVKDILYAVCPNAIKISIPVFPIVFPEDVKKRVFDSEKFCFQIFNNEFIQEKNQNKRNETIYLSINLCKRFDHCYLRELDYVDYLFSF